MLYVAATASNGSAIPPGHPVHLASGLVQPAVSGVTSAAAQHAAHHMPACLSQPHTVSDVLEVNEGAGAGCRHCIVVIAAVGQRIAMSEMY